MVAFTVAVAVVVVVVLARIVRREALQRGRGRFIAVFVRAASAASKQRHA
jgi:hypothetical protein